MKFKTLLILTAVLIGSLVSCGGIKTNPELLKLIKSIPKNCDLGDSKGYTNNYGWKIEKCKNDEAKKAKEWLKTQGIAKALPTLAVTLGDKDTKVAATTVYLFNGLESQVVKISKDPKLVSGKVAKALITNLKKISANRWAQFSVRTVTRVATIKGLNKEIIAVAEPLDDKSPIKSSIYHNLVYFGRLKDFSTLKEVAKKDNSLSRTAIRAVGVLSRPTDGERKQVCEWWQSFLGDADVYKSAAAAAQMGRICKGEFLDKTMDEVEKRFAAKAEGKKFPGDYTWAVNYISCKKTILTPNPRGTTEQCARKEELKAKIKK
ncbi:MAG: hypothetical protein AAF518_12915 [Spirochaetota bacterium]